MDTSSILKYKFKLYLSSEDVGSPSNTTLSMIAITMGSITLARKFITELVIMALLLIISMEDQLNIFVGIALLRQQGRGSF